MLQWFIRFPEFAEFTEFLIHLGQTPLLCIIGQHEIWYTETMKQWRIQDFLERGLPIPEEVR